jgi:hypothetical protein
MRALDAYRDVKHELDKYASPTFEPEQFNHFFNFGLDKYITDNYSLYDVFQKNVDDIRSIVKSSSELALTDGKVTLPNDYRHMLKIKMKGTFNTNVGKYPQGLEKWFNKVERRLSGEEGYREENAYLKPSHKSVYYELEGNTLIISCGTKVTPNTVILQYIKELPVIFLSPNPGADFNLEANNTTIPFPQHVYRELVRVCANEFLENIQSPRYQVRLQSEQLRAQ